MPNSIKLMTEEIEARGSLLFSHINPRWIDAEFEQHLADVCLLVHVLDALIADATNLFYAAQSASESIADDADTNDSNALNNAFDMTRKSRGQPIFGET